MSQSPECSLRLGIEDVDPQTHRMLTIVMLSISSLSLSALIFFFLVFRRNVAFRQKLFFLLLISDIIRTVLFFSAALERLLVCNKVTWSRTSCRAFGFFLVQSRLGADFLMLVFAVHLAITLIKPDYQNPSRNGLYPYRKFVYLLWILVPSSVAVVPLSKDDGFRPTIYGCDVSFRDFGLAFISLLAWRGVLFILTIACYVVTSIIVLRKYFKVSKSLRVSYELLDYADPTAAGMRQRLMQTVTSLGFMFVYPSLYLALWSPPFVVRLLHRTNFFHQHPHSFMYLIMVICICSHTFFDVLLYLLFRSNWSPDEDNAPPNYILLFRACRELYHGQWRTFFSMLRISSAEPSSCARWPATISSRSITQTGSAENDSEVIDFERFLETA